MVKSTKNTEQANHIAVFQEASIRRVWHNEEWWFSVVDVCAILTASLDAGAYWRKLKQCRGRPTRDVLSRVETAGSRLQTARD